MRAAHRFMQLHDAASFDERFEIMSTYTSFANRSWLAVLLLGACVTATDPPAGGDGKNDQSDTRFAFQIEGWDHTKVVPEVKTLANLADDSRFLVREDRGLSLFYSTSPNEPWFSVSTAWNDLDQSQVVPETAATARIAALTKAGGDANLDQTCLESSTGKPAPDDWLATCTTVAATPASQPKDLGLALGVELARPGQLVKGTWRFVPTFENQDASPPTASFNVRVFECSDVRWVEADDVLGARCASPDGKTVSGSCCPVVCDQLEREIARCAHESCSFDPTAIHAARCALDPRER